MAQDFILARLPVKGSTITSAGSADAYKLPILNASGKIDQTLIDPLVISAELGWKNPVRVGTTANITLSGAQTIDGVAVVAGNRVLVKNQSAGANNGIYNCASGAWTRSTDANTSAELMPGTIVAITEGSTLADSVWILTTNTVVLGTTALNFAYFANFSNYVTLTTAQTITGDKILSGTNILDFNGGNFTTLSIRDGDAGNAVLMVGSSGGGIQFYDYSAVGSINTTYRSLTGAWTTDANGIRLGDTNASHYLRTYWNENDTADRSLALLVNGGNRSLSLSGDLTISAATTISSFASAFLTGVGTSARSLTLTPTANLLTFTGVGSDASINISILGKSASGITYLNGTPTFTYGGGTKVFTNVDGAGAGDFVVEDGDTHTSLMIAGQSVRFYDTGNVISANMTTRSLTGAWTTDLNGISLGDSNTSHYLRTFWNENDTANRDLALRVSGGSRTVTFAGDFAIAGNTTISAFGATLTDDANAATARTTLGLGDLAVQNANAFSLSAGILGDASRNLTLSTGSGSVALTATGSDANINVAISAKGSTGAVLLNALGVNGAGSSSLMDTSVPAYIKRTSSNGTGVSLAQHNEYILSPANTEIIAGALIDVIPGGAATGGAGHILGVIGRVQDSGTSFNLPMYGVEGKVIVAGPNNSSAGVWAIGDLNVSSGAGRTIKAFDGFCEVYNGTPSTPVASGTTIVYYARPPTGGDTALAYSFYGEGGLKLFNKGPMITLNSGGTTSLTMEHDGTQAKITNTTGALRIYAAAGDYMVLQQGNGFVPVTEGADLGIDGFRWDAFIRDLSVSRSVTSAGGIKHQRVTTGSINATSSAVVTLTWSAAFADANYTVNVSVVDTTAAALSLQVVHIESQSASAITVRVENTSAGALTGTLHAIAMHD